MSGLLSVLVADGQQMQLPLFPPTELIRCQGKEVIPP